MRHFSDEELTAFLDGESDHAPIAEIEAALDSDKELQKRLESLMVDIPLLKGAFEPVALNSPPLPDLEKIGSRDGRSGNNVHQMPVRDTSSTNNGMGSGFSFAQLAASVVVALGLGFGASQLIQPGEVKPGWRGYVAAYQALYAKETLASVKENMPDQLGELQRVAAALGKSISLDTLNQVEKLDYKRGQILSFNGKPLVQLAFVSPDGNPVALCIVAKPDSGNKPLSSNVMEGMRAASWTKGGYDFLLIGGKDEALVNNAASYFSAKI